MKVVGWTDCYLGYYPVVEFTADRKRALAERIRKRRYNFNYQDHCFLSCCCPVYDDMTTCELTKAQFDSVMSEAYKDIPLGQRLLPQDVIDRSVRYHVLFEKEKFEQEWSENNG